MVKQNENDESPCDVTMKEATTVTFTHSNNIQHKVRTNNDTEQHIDFIAHLPIELVTRIMEQFTSKELFVYLTVSKEWQHRVSACSLLWRTLYVLDSEYNFSNKTLLQGIAQHVLDLRFDFSYQNQLIAKVFFDQMRHGSFYKLEKLYIRNPYISNKRMAHLPTTAILGLSDTLKTLAITYDTDYAHIVEQDVNEALFLELNDSFTVDIFTPMATIISACSHLNCLRYTNPHIAAICDDIKIKNYISNINPSLTQLELELGSMESSGFISLLKLCPNLSMIRVVISNDRFNNSLLDSISEYCPHIQYLSFGYEDSWWIGDDAICDEFLEEIVTSATVKIQEQQSSSVLESLAIRIKYTDHVIPFFNRHSHSIQRMKLSLYTYDDASFTSMRPLNQLTFLEVTYIEDPNVLATILLKLPALQTLKFEDSNMADQNLILTLSLMQSLQELIIQNYTYMDTESMIELFNAYAERRPIVGHEDDKFVIAECNELYQSRLHIQQQLTCISLSGCDFMDDLVLEALGNIKTLSTVHVGFANIVTHQGINNFCQQLKQSPNIFSVGLAGLSCVDDSTLAILGSAPNIKEVYLRLLDNITKEGLNAYKEQKKNVKNSYILTLDCKNINRK